MKLKYIIDKDYDLSMIEDDETKHYYDTFYPEVTPVLEKTARIYQDSWNEINDEFSDYIERETENKWYYPEYFCIVSAIFEGISNWGRSPKIIRTWKENPYYQRRITAHELILSHYFEIYRRNFSDSGLKDGQVWALAEIAAFALTSLTDDVKKFWPWDDSGYYTDHNYPHIVEYQNRLKEVFLKRKSFKDYIMVGIEMVKEDKELGPD